MTHAYTRSYRSVPTCLAWLEVVVVLVVERHHSVVPTGVVEVLHTHPEATAVRHLQELTDHRVEERK